MGYIPREYSHPDESIEAPPSQEISEGFESSSQYLIHPIILAAALIIVAVIVYTLFCRW